PQTGTPDRETMPGSMKLKRPMESATLGLANSRKRSIKSARRRGGDGRMRNPSFAFAMLTAHDNAPMRSSRALLALVVLLTALALGSTWDRDLVGRVSAAIARETGSRGIRQVLSPVVNIADDVRWGRVEETYGEDPYLSSVMGRAFVEAFERAGIVATPKHF